MHKFHSLNVVIGFPPMSEVFFSTDLCRHHTFCGGVSRVVRAMAEKTRSRSPVRVPDEAAMSEAPTLKPRLDYFLTNSQVLFSSLFPKDLV